MNHFKILKILFDTFLEAKTFLVIFFSVTFLSSSLYYILYIVDIIIYMYYMQLYIFNYMYILYLIICTALSIYNGFSC